MFVEDMKVWNERRKVLLAEQDAAQTASTASQLLHTELGRLYRDKVGQLTAAFEDDALKAQAFDRLRALIEAVVLTGRRRSRYRPTRRSGIDAAVMCAESESQKASTGVTEEVASKDGCGDRI